MTDKIWYVSWRTWTEQEVCTPWLFWYLSEGGEYRARAHSGAPPFDELKWAAAFETADQLMLDQLNLLYVNDVKLCAFLETTNEEQAQLEVLSLFSDAEFDKVSWVDLSTQQSIKSLFHTV